ncbi:LysR family transcriptional regulator [Devosia limi DSM 17137]|uniref:DNA-binding transcriptional regulator, LysR family n=1 Tax=Devosia limi DSM 17137 TaxID=1121477 RepID=A0A0F5LVX4_9HYPH|nr:LysR family transcriptional regulator [Devosia limi]KKB86324.1 LysR family transcriptional regulator [Devosia limi DSM 17137]SHF73765.1 DNA-binding transcriptional regulator, LysR family [Devosia limi DSM 17137]
MDLDQLRTFDRIVRDQSFTRAAAYLNITQATASMRIRALEQLLGVTLFVRGRTVTLTDQGMTFLPFARRIIGTAQEAREALRRVERGRIAIGSLRSLVSPLITESLLRFQEKYPGVDVVVNEGRQSQIAAMLHEREVEMGILCWPNLDPLIVDLVPLMIMRERVPLVVAPEIAARLPARPSIEEVLELVPRVISLRWWQAEPETAAALVRMAKTSVDLPTGPARRLALKGQGLGFFVASAIADDVAAGRLVEIAPTDFEPLHRDTAMVVRSLAALERDMLADFIAEIAVECAKIGVILDNRLEALRPKVA